MDFNAQSPMNNGITTPSSHPVLSVSASLKKTALHGKSSFFCFLAEQGKRRLKRLDKLAIRSIQETLQTPSDLNKLPLTKRMIATIEQSEKYYEHGLLNQKLQTLINEYESTKDSTYKDQIEMWGYAGLQLGIPGTHATAALINQKLLNALAADNPHMALKFKEMGGTLSSTMVDQVNERLQAAVATGNVDQALRWQKLGAVLTADSKILVDRALQTTIAEGDFAQAEEWYRLGGTLTCHSTALLTNRVHTAILSQEPAYSLSYQWIALLDSLPPETIDLFSQQQHLAIMSGDLDEARHLQMLLEEVSPPQTLAPHLITLLNEILYEEIAGDNHVTVRQLIKLGAECPPLLANQGLQQAVFEGNSYDSKVWQELGATLSPDLINHGLQAAAMRGSAIHAQEWKNMGANCTQPHLNLGLRIAAAKRQSHAAKRWADLGAIPASDSIPLMNHHLLKAVNKHELYEASRWKELGATLPHDTLPSINKALQQAILDENAECARACLNLGAKVTWLP